MKPLEVAAAFVAGLVGMLAIDLFVMPALVVVTLLLILGTALRAPAVVLGCAISCGLMLVLWILAIARCDQTFQNCTIDPSGIALLFWLAAGSILGTASSVILVARSRRR